MGTIRRLTDLQLGSISSTKVLTITSNETIYVLSSGARACEVGNMGTAAILLYGQSGLLTNSGGMMINTGGGAKFWDSVVDNFQLALRHNSGVLTIQVIVHEYGGNNVT